MPNGNTGSLPATYTVGETARVLGVSKATVRREIHSGRLAAVRVGQRSLRVTKDALEAYLAHGVVNDR